MAASIGVEKADDARQSAAFPLGLGGSCRGADGWVYTAVSQSRLCAPDDQLALIEVGVDTRETVAAKVGRPSTAGLLNDTGWYYVQSRWETVGPREPQEIDRQVVAITFTPEGTVTDVGRFGLSDGQVVALSRRVTQTNVQGAGFIRQLLGNIGGLRAEQVVQ